MTRIKENNSFTVWKRHSSTRFLRSERKALAPDERVQEGRLADIGSPDEGELRKPIGGAILRLFTALHELSGGDLSIPRVGPKHDVGTFEHPPIAHERAFGKLNIRRDEELLEREMELRIVGNRLRVIGEGRGDGDGKIGSGGDGGDKSGIEGEGAEEGIETSWGWGRDEEEAGEDAGLEEHRIERQRRTLH